MLKPQYQVLTTKAMMYQKRISPQEMMDSVLTCTKQYTKRYLTSLAK